MGKTTGGDLKLTADRVKKHLNSKAKDYKDYPASLSVVNKKAFRIGSKIGNRASKKANTPDAKKDLKRWAQTDFMKHIVDWKEQLGNLLVESALLEGSLSSKKALRRLKFSRKHAKSDDSEKRDLGYNTYKKWHKKKMMRAQTDSYKAKLGDKS
jgi:hypothetical protein